MCTWEDVRWRELADDNTVLWVYAVDEFGNSTYLLDEFHHAYEIGTFLGYVINQMASRYDPGVSLYWCSECHYESDYWGDVLNHFGPDLD